MSQTGDAEESNLGAGVVSSCAIGHRAAEESRDSRLWRSVVIGEQEHRIDMKCIESYKRVISHGGMQTQISAEALPLDTLNAILAYCFFYGI